MQGTYKNARSNGIYKSHFSCLLSPFLNSRLRRQPRCVSRRCVFCIVASDRIIFLTEAITRSTFGLVQHNRNVMQETIKQVFQPVIFENASCALAREIEFVFPVSLLSTDFHVFISDSVSWRYLLPSAYRERNNV